ncbi:MAG: energy transducer TonB [Mucilaginibacter sp.]
MKPLKPIVFALSILLTSFVVKAQEKVITAVVPPAGVPVTTTDGKKIYIAVEKDPGFRGGLQNFYQYLIQNITYPPNAAKNRIQGKVFLTFVIEKDGSLSDVKVVRGVSTDIDAEAIRVVANSPKWIPGLQNGHPVRVQYTMPINFTLPN